MAQLLYRFLLYVAGQYGLTGLMQPNEHLILTIFAALALACCLFGFYVYRGAVSGLAFVCTALAGSLWIWPVWGQQAAVTFSAVLGVVFAFLSFRWYRPGSMALCAAIAGSGAYLAATQCGASTAAALILTALACAGAGVLTFFFPFRSVCAFTALWGAAAFCEEGWRLWSVLPGPGSAASVVLAVILAAAGFGCQLFLFRGQKLFPAAKPRRKR